MKNIRFMLTFLLLIGGVLVSAQKNNNDENYKIEIRNKLQLDYSMPDYSTSSIEAKIIGPRLAKILVKLCDTYQQYMNLSALAVIQSSQVEGLSYGRIKTMKLDKIIKQGNEIIIRFNTTLEPNNLDLKKSQIVFRFIEGVSDDIATNDFFSNICRYLKD